MDDLKKLFSGWFGLAFLLAAAAHVLLGVYAPDSRGYAYDLYTQALYLVSNELRLPNHTDCWICYHPPLYPLAGAAILKIVAALGYSPEAGQYAVSYFGSVLSLVLSVYGFLLYLLYRKHPGMDLVLWILILFVPVKFINSFAIEADMLGAALLVAATYHFAVYLRKRTMPHLILSAFIVGLAALTKYSGLVVALIFGLALLWVWIRDRNAVNFKRGLAYAVIAFAVGGWLYISNMVEYGTPIPGNAVWKMGEKYWDHYDFTSFGLQRIIDVFDPDAEPAVQDLREYWKDQSTAQLWRFPQYNQQVLTSLYGQTWTDFSFFSVAGRHGIFEFQNSFKGKTIPPALLWSLLITGLIPVVFGVLGFLLLAGEGRAKLLIGLSVVTVAVYLNWVAGYTIWMLKTKYLMFLIPNWLVFIDRFAGVIGPRATSLLVWPAALSAVAYCFAFAII